MTVLQLGLGHVDSPLMMSTIIATKSRSASPCGLQGHARHHGILFIAVSFSARNGPSGLAATAAGENTRHSTDAKSKGQHQAARSNWEGKIHLHRYRLQKKLSMGRQRAGMIIPSSQDFFENQALQCQPSMQLS